MKYKAGRLNNGNWAVMAGKKYFSATEQKTRNGAEIEALMMSAHWYQEQMRKVHIELDRRGMLDDHDPYGYLC